MKNAFILFTCALSALACGGGAGHAAAADGPLPSGSHAQRSLELVEDEPEASQAQPPAGDGTTTPEIVKSVEKDRP